MSDIQALKDRMTPYVASEALLERGIAAAREALLAKQNRAGYWLYELEADCTIPAEFILLMHFLGEIDAALQPKLATYLREQQAEHGGWPLYHGGDFNISCSVKAYYALKLVGDDPQAPHMIAARTAILKQGGAARANVFTRLTLAMFGQIPWRGVPYIPAEIMLFPKWFPFHLDKVAYWSRTVMVPLFILCSRRATAKNPQQVHIPELFTTPPELEQHYFLQGGGFIRRLFLLLDKVGRRADALIPRRLRALAIRRALEWCHARANGEDGLGAIFPAMVNYLEAMVILGYAADDPRVVLAKKALRKLLVTTERTAYCQPCVSPVWDTALSCLSLDTEGSSAARSAAHAALKWLVPLQLLDHPGDWRLRRPGLRGGGWAFQFANGYYPDLDDTAVVAWAMHAVPERECYASAVTRALDWLVGMQSKNGGFAAFDIDNTYDYLNEIPFADHGALLDPPTADVTGRVVTVLARVGRPQDQSALERAIAYLRATQETNGAWFGRWGTNYIYGTWSVLTAFAAAGISADDPAVRCASGWLAACQHPDGGWGESNDTYQDRQLAGRGLESTPYQTAWALLALMAAHGRVGSVERRGIHYLLSTQQSGGQWGHPSFTSPGFPRVFYLKYHGYCAYFPLWALSQYRRLTQDRLDA